MITLVGAKKKFRTNAARKNVTLLHEECAFPISLMVFDRITEDEIYSV
jgi:hypothetical protein